ncbi:hypothetical protein QWY93_18945 [Echinicola jeungdonensis]|nr:hypothetical protein [Echinicola jeungdonensis]MDN3671347.1 hypothetical protein [Echinicola jeungdonensis]
MILQSLVFWLAFIGSDLLSIPFDYYHTLKLKKSWVNKTTRKTFLEIK